LIAAADRQPVLPAFLPDTTFTAFSDPHAAEDVCVRIPVPRASFATVPCAHTAGSGPGASLVRAFRQSARAASDFHKVSTSDSGF